MSGETSTQGLKTFLLQGTLPHTAWDMVSLLISIARCGL